MNMLKNIKPYLALSIFIHITLIIFLLSIKTGSLKEPRVAFVDLIDIPRAPDIAKSKIGVIESKKKKKTPVFRERPNDTMVGRVPDLPVNPNLMPERSFPLQSKKRKKRKGTVKRSRKSAGKGSGSSIPSVKEITPSLGKMVLASKGKKKKGVGEGKGENIGSKNKRKEEGDYSETAEGGTILTPLDRPAIKYISYFASIKRKIELVWQYPFEAVQRGIQGDVVVDFSIGRDGKLRKVTLVKSSGFKLLDREAIESIRKGSPFSPIPATYEIDVLNIRANFIYEMRYLKIR